MKFYRVRYTSVDENQLATRRIMYLFSPLRSLMDISRYMFNVIKPRYPNGFFIRDITEISQEEFTKENTANLQTMVLVMTEEDA